MYTHALRNSDSSSWVAARPLASFKPSKSCLWLTLAACAILFGVEQPNFLGARGKYLRVDGGHLFSFSQHASSKKNNGVRKSSLCPAKSVANSCAGGVQSGTFPSWSLIESANSLQMPELNGVFETGHESPLSPSATGWCLELAVFTPQRLSRQLAPSTTFYILWNPKISNRWNKKYTTLPQKKKKIKLLLTYLYPQSASKAPHSSNDWPVVGRQVEPVVGTMCKVCSCGMEANITWPLTVHVMSRWDGFSIV